MGRQYRGTATVISEMAVSLEWFFSYRGNFRMYGFFAYGFISYMVVILRHMVSALDILVYGNYATGSK